MDLINFMKLEKPHIFENGKNPTVKEIIIEYKLCEKEERKALLKTKKTVVRKIE